MLSILCSPPTNIDKLSPVKRAEDPNFSNVQFYTGKIEELDQIVELKNGFFDVIVSNCVINLCTDKVAALQHAYNLLRVGGEMYFSDVYADRRCPKALLEDRVLYGECISGALYWNDFLQIAKTVGFRDPRVLGKSSPFKIINEEIIMKVEGYKFYSVTARLWKHPEMELTQEDYGYVVTYNGSFNAETGDIGSLPDCTAKATTGCCGGDADCVPFGSFQLDADHTFECCVPTPVSGNTYLMLQSSRFSTMFGFKILSNEPACCSGAPEDDNPMQIPSPLHAVHLCPFVFSAAKARIGGSSSSCCEGSKADCCSGASPAPQWAALWPFDDTVGQESGADTAGGCCGASDGCC